MLDAVKLTPIQAVDEVLTLHEVSLWYHYLGNKQLATSEENRARQLFGVKLYFNCKTLFYAYTCRS